ncbi:sugar kinase [Vulcaniibacterium tengchongense]|uniref:2-dehydro-3-deoxygluconokinase n=1 Tax=Vulcaniibacterium tengchongense TaxID=1273429 RepID=A0A3N4V0F8_9GAMM|nr:sugar kinase [Vulcaniibacterium tengchongense]RPE75918.1 2-dehydro-3-deoxygluconokinase [Vulcaniibacterium tengchongense]
MNGTVVCFGELLLRLSAPGRERLLQTPRLQVQIGGAEANVAVSLARLGHDAAMAGTVADNALGEAALGELRRHGVDTRRMRAAPGRMGLYFLAPGALQRPSEVLYDRADSAFARTPASAYDWDALLEGAAWLHLSGVSPALGAECAQATLDAARAARRRGVRVSFDGNFRGKLWQAWNGDAGAILRQIFAETDLLFADHRDIAVALGQTFAGEDHEAAVAAAAQAAFAAFPHLQRLACTQRQQRSVDHHHLSALLLTRAGGRERAPGYELAGIVDRIGTGDAFAAGVLHGLIDGMDDARALRFGLAAACLKHSVPGDFNLVGRAEIEALVEEAGFHVRR